jgi:hypothetical protein
VEAISGHPMLVASAIDAVKQWKYQWYVLNGQPPERKTEAVVDFSLESGEGHAATLLCLRRPRVSWVPLRKGFLLVRQMAGLSAPRQVYPPSQLRYACEFRRGLRKRYW